jgi:hypothetical protein
MFFRSLNRDSRLPKVYHRGIEKTAGIRAENFETRRRCAARSGEHGPVGEDIDGQAYPRGKNWRGRVHGSIIVRTDRLHLMGENLKRWREDQEPVTPKNNHRSQISDLWSISVTCTPPCVRRTLVTGTSALKSHNDLDWRRLMSLQSHLPAPITSIEVHVLWETSTL